MGEPNIRVKQIRPVHYRAIFISDVHLGHSGCSARFLLDFLRSTTCDYLFLVGDIIDIWQMKKRLYWPQEHNDVVRTILGKAKHGTRIFYIPGNHDEVIKDYDKVALGNLEIHREYVHITISGQRFLVVHGDEYDCIVTHSRILALIGSTLYDVLLTANSYVNFLRRKLGFSYWSLAGVLKHAVKNAVNYIGNFEKVLAYEARKYQVDGLITGHIHKAEISLINGMIYCNCGDWVESCTALVERRDGSLELLHWTERQTSVKTYPPVAA